MILIFSPSVSQMYAELGEHSRQSFPTFLSHLYVFSSSSTYSLNLNEYFKNFKSTIRRKNAMQYPPYQFLGYGNLSKTHHCEHKEVDAVSF